jgi:hypothetical protein
VKSSDPVESKPLTIDHLTQEARDVALQVHAAQERLEDREFIATVHAAVDRLSQHMRELVAGLPAGEQLKADRVVGRRVADLRRMADLLPRVPAIASTSTPDRQVSGASTVGERRITGVSWSGGTRGPGSAGLAVGGEVEAWCGKCGDLKTHNVVAMVGTEPKQVLCQACGSRHIFRIEPARKRAGEGDPEGSGGGSSRRSAPDPEAARRIEASRVLADEIARAPLIRAFDPKERYKAGEIISHPTYGPGKVENVLRSSLLVRFSRSGLKPLTLL